jgi:ABC-type sugar transport system substrate-binding protein
MGKRLLTILVVLLVSAGLVFAQGTGLHKLTQQDILDIYSPTSDAVYQDTTMKTGIKSAALKDVQLTEAEKAKIRTMKLNIGIEQDHLDDAMKWVQQAIKDQCADLGITVKSVWIATAMDSGSISQLADYQRIEAIAQNYDCIFSAVTDTSTSSDILKKIMKKTKMSLLLSVPFGLDWNDPNFAGISDIDAYTAGIYSAKAAIKILGGKGTIGTVGFIAGYKGTINTCYQRYRGWDKVFAENPGVKVVQKWFDDPNQTKAVVSSLMSANPDIKVLLIDWANPPADQAQQVFKERGLKPWKDISMVTIDFDNTVIVPMAKDGPDNNYAGAFITQTWYAAGANMVKLYIKKLLYGDKAPKYVVSPPLPVTTYNNLRTHAELVVPAGFQIPAEITKLTNQSQLGVSNQWK